MTNLDRYDRALLSELQTNTRINMDALAGRVGLSVASVQRRLKRLRESKVIKQEVAVLDPDAVGASMTMIVMVELEREHSDKLENFQKLAAEEEQVQQCYYVTGEADFCLICTARSMSDFEALTRRLFFDNENVRRFRTSIVMRRSKVGLAVSLREE